jgi:transcriptional regulator with XRE-family HTH domain
LKELRAQAGLTQQQLAERAGIHKLTVAKFEQGLREPGWSTVQALVDALGVSCDALRQAPASQHVPQRGRPAKAKETEPAPKRPRGRPRKEAPAAVPSTPPAGELESEAEAVGRRRKGK